MKKSVFDKLRVIKDLIQTNHKQLSYEDLRRAIDRIWRYNRGDIKKISQEERIILDCLLKHKINIGTARQNFKAIRLSRGLQLQIRSGEITYHKAKKLIKTYNERDDQLFKQTLMGKIRDFVKSLNYDEEYIQIISTKKKKRQPFTKQQIIDFFNNCHNVKVALICFISLVTAYRLSEVLSLKQEYFDWEKRIITHPFTKGGKTRTAFIDDNYIIDILKDWCSMQSGDYLFPSQDRTISHITPTGFITEFRKVLQRANLWIEAQDMSNGKKYHKYTFHNWRTTFICIALANDIPLEDTAILVGHSSIRITEKYYASFGCKKVRKSLRKVWGSYDVEPSNPITQKPIQQRQEIIVEPIKLLQHQLVTDQISIEDFERKAKALKG